MRIGFLADPHLGNFRLHGGPLAGGLNDRARHVTDVLQRAATVFQREACSAVMVLGDLFDVDRPEPPLLRAAQRWLDGLRREVGPVYIIVGNHDQHSTSPGDHALAPLADHAHVVDVATRIPSLTPEGSPVEVLAFPFEPGRAAEWMEAAVARMEATVGPPPAPGVVRLLVLHAGVIDDRTPVYLHAAHDALPLDQLRALGRRLGCACVFAGNWHERRTWLDTTPGVVQVGATVPTGWDNPGRKGYGSAVVYDTDHATVTCHEVLGPRFLKLTSLKELADLHQRTLQGERLFVRLVLPADQRAPGLAALAAAQADGRLHSSELVVDGDAERALGADAAARARAQTSLDAALGAYITAMALPSGVTPEAVLARTRAFLTAPTTLKG